jgi:two-component system response regulator RegA
VRLVVGRELLHPIKTVLVVDDDAAVLSLFRSSFRGAGKQVFATTSGASALGIAKQEQPDFALVDLFLAGEWGIDVVARLRAESPRTEIALMSGYLGVAATITALRLGARHVFWKPVSCRAILDQVEHGIHVFDRESKRPGFPTLARVEWEHIMRVLVDSKGVISVAARRLGIRRQSLQQRLKKAVPAD